MFFKYVNKRPICWTELHIGMHLLSSNNKLLLIADYNSRRMTFIDLADDYVSTMTCDLFCRHDWSSVDPEPDIPEESYK